MFTIVTSFLLPLQRNVHWLYSKVYIPHAGSIFRLIIQSHIFCTRKLSAKVHAALTSNVKLYVVEI